MWNELTWNNLTMERNDRIPSLLPAFFCMLRWIQFESQQSVCNQFLQQTLHASWQVQHDTFSKNVIDLCCILYNKPRMVATFFFQRTTAVTLFSIVASLQISCFRKPKEKQYAKLNKRIVARLIWQLVIPSCVIFAYIISRRVAKTMVSWQAFPSFASSSRACRVSLAPKTPFPFPFKRLPRRLTSTCIFKRYTYLFVQKGQRQLDFAFPRD